MNMHIDWMSVALSGLVIASVQSLSNSHGSFSCLLEYTSQNLSKIDPNSNIDPPPFF